VDDAKDYHKSRQTRQIVGKFLGDGLVLSEGSVHQQQRAILQPAFIHRQAAGHARTVTECVDRALDRWCGQRVEDLGRELRQVTLEIAAQAFFGLKLEPGDRSILDAMGVFESAISGRFRSIPLPEWIPTRRNREQRAAIKLLHASLDKLLQRAVADTSPSSATPLDLLTSAHRAGTLTREQVRDQLTTLFFAGHETIANLLLWSVYAISRRPEVVKAIRSELGTLETLDSIEQNLDKCKYLKAAIDETLRLYPPTWVFDRMPIRDVELGGYRIPKGSKIFISPYITQRDSRWFEAPLEFRPERFLPAAEGQPPKGRFTRSAFFPFGLGARFCIGYNMALMEAKVALARIFGGYEVEVLTAGEPEPAPSATLGMKHPFSVKFTRRQGTGLY
jgi:cytochrome P450